MILVAREAEEVRCWYVVFHLKEGRRGYERLIPGRFAHVSAFAFLERARSWVLCSFSPVTGPCVAVFPLEADDEMRMPAGLVDWTRNSSILKADVRRKRDFTPKWGFFCVSAVKLMLGCKSRALFPEGLWRDLIGDGAEMVFDGVDESPGAEAGPGPAGPDGAGAIRPAEGRLVLP